MATPDIVIATVIVLSALFGLMRGLVREVVSLVVWVGAAISSVVFAGFVADTILASFDLGRPLRVAMGFALVFIAVLIVGAMAQRILGKLVKSTGLDGTDRVMGLVFGGFRGAVVVIVALMAARPFAQHSGWWMESQLRPELLAFEDDLLELFGAARKVVDDGQGVPPRPDRDAGETSA